MIRMFKNLDIDSQLMHSYASDVIAIERLGLDKEALAAVQKKYNFATFQINPKQKASEKKEEWSTEEIKFTEGIFRVKTQKIPIKELALKASSIYIDLIGETSNGEAFASDVMSVLSDLKLVSSKEIRSQEVFKKYGTYMKIKAGFTPAIFLKPEFLEFAESIKKALETSHWTFDAHPSNITIHYFAKPRIGVKSFGAFQLSRMTNRLTSPPVVRLSVADPEEYEKGILSVFAEVDSDSLKKSLSELAKKKESMK
jgi:hypothetical protein